MSSDEHGSITVLLAGVTFIVLVLGVVVAGVAQVVAARFQAATAADAAALAAAAATFHGDPNGEARALAAANGASLLSCRCTPDQTWTPRTVETLVEIRVDVLGLGTRTVRAVGRAEYVPHSSEAAYLDDR